MIQFATLVSLFPILVYLRIQTDMDLPNADIRLIYF